MSVDNGGQKPPGWFQKVDNYLDGGLSVHVEKVALCVFWALNMIVFGLIWKACGSDKRYMTELGVSVTLFSMLLSYAQWRFFSRFLGASFNKGDGLPWYHWFLILMFIIAGGLAWNGFDNIKRDEDRQAQLEREHQEKHETLERLKPGIEAMEKINQLRQDRENRKTAATSKTIK